MQNYVYPWATFGREPMATLAQSRARRADPHLSREASINVVVVGGETNGYWRIMGAQIPQDRQRRRLALAPVGRGTGHDLGRVERRFQRAILHRGVDTGLQ